MESYKILSYSRNSLHFMEAKVNLHVNSLHHVPPYLQQDESVAMLC